MDKPEKVRFPRRTAAKAQTRAHRKGGTAAVRGAWLFRCDDGGSQISLGRAMAGEPDMSPVWRSHQQLGTALMTDHVAAEIGVDPAPDKRLQLAAAMRHWGESDMAGICSAEAVVWGAGG